jgi:NADH dehydrogenase
LACLPTTSDEERKRLLSFVVSGGGPTGVEFAAELYDMLNEDMCRHYPRMLRNQMSVHVIQSRGHILNTYDEALSRFAEARFAHDNVDVQTNARVKEVTPDRIIFTQKTAEGETVTKELPMGFCLWSTGVSQTEFSKKIADKLGDNQTNKHALETDTHLRLTGAPLGDVYAIGDCSTVQNNVSDHIITFLRTLAWEKGKEPETMQITYPDWRHVAKRVRQKFPQAGDHLRRLDKLFEAYDKDQSGTLDFGELSELLKQIDSKLTSLPATAQRANQQGLYLGRKLNKLAQAAPGLAMNDIADGDIDSSVYKAFTYTHMGSLAYIGNAAVFDFNGLNFGGGLLAVYLWRGVYFAQSVSLRTRVLLAMDWGKRTLFGRGKLTYPFVPVSLSLGCFADFCTISRHDELLDLSALTIVSCGWHCTYPASRTCILSNYRADIARALRCFLPCRPKSEYSCISISFTSRESDTKVDCEVNSESVVCKQRLYVFG